MRFSASLLILALLAAPVSAQIRVSANGRYLEQAGGKPLLYLADTAWELIHRLTREETGYYMKNREAKGFTVIQFSALPLEGELNDPNVYGDRPFLEGNPEKPNPAWFQHVDYVVAKAAEHGLVAGLLPTWGRHWKQRGAKPPLLNAENVRRYGEFLGRRYRTASVIWILGGDDNPTLPAERATIDALAAGLRAGDGGAHLITFHPRGPGLSSTFLQDAKWLDFHMAQSSHAARDHDTGLYIENDRALRPPRPTLDGEPRYEALNIGFYLKDHSRLLRFDDSDARQAAYWAMLAGACGHTYGNNNVWQMWAPGRKSALWADTHWREALDHPGAFQMGHLRRLFESRPWQLLEPAQQWIASGPRDGGAKIRAALASDRSFGFVYSPRGEPFTLDQRRLRGERIRESWFDPRYGTVYPLHTSDTMGFQTYVPPTKGRGQDWLLILEDPSLAASLPPFEQVASGLGGPQSSPDVPALSTQSSNYPPAPPEADPGRLGHGIQRTMALLAGSTPGHRNPVRILFYGQSITKQEWSQLVAQDLRTRFPYADLTIENRAIGGYSTEYLVQTVAHDVYGFYPDLVIFHDFGGEENYEKMIAGIRRNTTAEILIQSDFPTWSHVDGVPDPPASVKREAFHDKHSFEWLPDLCRRYGCEVIDVRRPWSQYLKQTGKQARQLTTDGTHLNAEGNYLLAELTKRRLRYDRSLASASDMVRTVEGDALVWKDGRLRLEFTGNRVEVVAGAGPQYHAEIAEVRIDGKRPSEIPELYFITRPTDTFAVDWPAVNRVSNSKPLLAEDWTLRVLEAAADDSRWRFSVTGSRTGADGEGSSSELFVSKSGRVVIDPREWGVERAYRLRKITTPVGFEVRWKVLPLFADYYYAPRIADPAAEYVTLLASGLPAGKHTLELITTDKTRPPIRAIRIYNPPLRGN